MVELAAVKKNKITLSDYNYKRDIENRLLMSTFSTLDLALLEEILFSPLNFSFKKLARNIGEDEALVLPALEKFKQAGLLTIDSDLVSVDKEMRKYYESEVVKFDPNFKPDMEYLQGLLKKVPIHALPIWYATPRTSNNIFDSLVEKYLATPQIFHRYLMEFNLGDPTVSAMAQDVFRAPDFCMTAQELIEKYGLTKGQFEEYMLLLEFHFICCLGYRKEKGVWKEIVTPFHEWREYLLFMRNTIVKSVPEPDKVKRTRPHDQSFILDITAVLKGKKEEFEPSYLQQIQRKIALLKIDHMQEWLEMRQENRAIFIYRHPLNRMLSVNLPLHLTQEKALREAERCISRVLHSGWMFFEDFLKGVMIPLHEPIALKKVGKSWRYTLPDYTDDEKALLRATIFEWLFEVGITATGTYEGKECFCVTPFGQSLFG